MTLTNRIYSSRFLGGTLLSSIGSRTFTISSMAFMKLSGYSLLQIGSVVASIRLVDFTTHILFGNVADRLNPRLIIITTEIAGAFLSVMLALAWSKGTNYYYTFFSLLVIRSIVMGIQSPARSKIAKLYSDPSYQSNAQTAIWLNNATHGAMFFAAGFSWFSIKYLNFYWVIGFDFFTFLINGFLLYSVLLPKISGTTRIDGHFFQWFREFYSRNPKIGFYDLLLSIALAGGNIFTIRFTANREELIPIMLSSFGLAVWTAGYLEKKANISKYHSAIWLIFGTSFIMLSMFSENAFLTFMLFVMNDNCYWLLFHRYSVEIQAATRVENMASVSAARMIQMSAVLASGEFLVGWWQKFVPLFWEGAWRSIFCIIVALLAYFVKIEGKKRDEILFR